MGEEGLLAGRIAAKGKILEGRIKARTGNPNFKWEEE